MKSCGKKTYWVWSFGRSEEVYEHRLVMERELGRQLATDEVVHHLNHDSLDNRPANLEVMSKGRHTALHLAENNWLPGKASKLPEGKWSRRFDACVTCEKSDSRMASKGECQRCYTRRKKDEGIYGR